MRMRDVGWVWEGQGLDPGVYPSIFGVGEGAEYFGLSRACFMFHPNNELAMEKLRPLDAVICDIAKWKYRNTPGGGSEHWVDAAPDSVRAEAENVSRLSTRYPNIAGALHDDMKGLMQREGYRPEDYAPICGALKSANPNLALWAVVYTHELEKEYWKDWAGAADVVSLWVWDSSRLPGVEAEVARCRKTFPRQRVNMGVYIRDYSRKAPVELPMLEAELSAIRRLMGSGDIEGYSILGNCLIDQHPEQAAFIRDYIRDH